MKPEKPHTTQPGPAGGRSASRIVSRLGAAFLALALVLSMAVTAFAYTRIDTTAQTSLTVGYLDADGDGIPGAAFRLYRVGDVTEAARLSLSGDFAGAPVDLDGMDSTGEWNTAAATLAGYAAANGFAPAAAGTTDGNGRIVFDGLTVGLYLLSGDAAILGDSLYTPAASLILLPTLDDATDEWTYSPAAVVKYTAETLQEYTDITVKKEWKDNNYSGRPDSVTVQLVRDGAVIDTVALDADNGWKYTWTDLPLVDDPGAGTACTYTVNEADVPDGYTVAVSQSGYTYTFTNTHETDTNTPTTPSTPGTTTTPSSPTLPQTGQLNWPIPILAAGGLLLICAGLYIRGKKANKVGK